MNRQLYQYHPRIGYTFIPDLKARVQHEAGGYLIRTNNKGFRSEVDFVPKKTDKKRILLFGDSYTAADGVSNKKRYSDQLMDDIGNVEIYNFGLPGSGTDQQYLIYKEFAENIEHDLIIITVLVENIRRVNAKFKFYLNEKGQRVCYQKPYFKVQADGALALQNVPVPKHEIPYIELEKNQKKEVEEGGKYYWLRSRISNPVIRDFLQKFTKYQPLPEYNKPNNPEWLLLRAILTRWIRELRKPVIIIPLPLHQHVEGTSNSRKYQDRFNELSADLGIKVFDPLPDLLGYPPKDRRNFRFATDAHPTPEGHRAIAKSILEPVLKELSNNK